MIPLLEILSLWITSLLSASTFEMLRYYISKRIFDRYYKFKYKQRNKYLQKTLSHPVSRQRPSPQSLSVCRCSRFNPSKYQQWRQRWRKIDSYFQLKLIFLQCSMFVLIVVLPPWPSCWQHDCTLTHCLVHNLIPPPWHAWTTYLAIMLAASACSVQRATSPPSTLALASLRFLTF